MKAAYLLLIIALSSACVKRIDDKKNTSDTLISYVVSYDSINPLIYPDSLKHYVDKANRLKRLYKQCADNHNQEDEKAFFDEFPSDFKTFAIIYCNGMMEYSFQNLLIEESERHVHYFLYEIRSINIKVIYNKVISLSINGQWDPDDALQEQLREIIIENGDVFFSVLAGRSDEEVKSFFAYLFNSPHPPQKLPEKFYDFQKSCPKIISLAEEGLKVIQIPE